MKHIQKLTTRNGNKGTIIKAHQSAIKPVQSKAKIVINKVEIPQPLINILTRTSGRPLGFKRCHESVKNQTYKNVRHIVSIDNLQDEEYVKECGVDYFLMDKDAIYKEADIPDPKTGPRFIYNLYLNKLIEKVNDGWIIILDDDDYLADNNVLQKVANIAKSNTDMLLWQMKYPNGGLLPSLQELGKPPRLARISSQCFAVHSGVAKTIKWDGWKCGDFRFIQKVWAKTVDKRVIKEPLICLGGIGLGQRNDVNVSANILNKVYNNTSEINGKTISNLLKGNNTNNSSSKKYVYLDIITPKTVFNESEKVLLVMTNYNRENYIISSIKSVLDQTHKDILLHIIDDNSTDNSINIVKEYIESNNIQNIRLTKSFDNLGTYHHRNHALYLNTYTYWSICDSDDIIIPTHVSKNINAIKSSNKVYSASKIQRIDYNTKKVIYEKYSEGTFFFHKSILNKIGYYDYNRFAADSEYQERVIKIYGEPVKLNEVTYYAYNYGDNLSFIHNSKERLDYKARYRSQHKNGLIYRKIQQDLHNIL
jgi:glycosyltransferase involved in cell wall biosynthesis